MKGYTIESNEKKKSRIPARLDLLQSLTGLILGLFIWVHIVLDSSIIFGKDAFSFVSRNMEFAFLSDTGHGYPEAVFFAVLIIFSLFIIHAILGVRKIPISWKQHRIIVDLMQGMRHPDTNLWYVQVVTGILLFFVGSTHLCIMLLNPGTIDAYLSADRVVSDNLWILYFVLLVCVGLHACIGLYRIILKWNLFTGKNPREFRQKLKTIRNRAIIVFLSIGILGLIGFIIVGLNHMDNVGERYNKKISEHEAASNIKEESGHASEKNIERSLHESVTKETLVQPSDAHVTSDEHKSEAGIHEEIGKEEQSTPHTDSHTTKQP